MKNCIGSILIIVLLIFSNTYVSNSQTQKTQNLKSQKSKSAKIQDADNTTTTHLTNLDSSNIDVEVATRITDTDADSADDTDDFWGDFDLKPRRHDLKQLFRFDEPTIELQAGIQQPNIDNSVFTQTFNKSYMGELRLGFTNRNNRIKSIYKYSFNYFFVSNGSTEFMSKADRLDTKVPVKFWSFGYSTSSAVAYNFGKGFGLVPYNTSGIIWTRLDYQDNNSTKNFTPKDSGTINAFNKDFRFGDVYEAGIRLQIQDPVMINAGFERISVYPRHMFWYWTLSKCIEGAAQGILGTFSNAVMRSSPVASPIVNFVLKNALGFAFTELRRQKMNWPFETAPPLIIDNYKVGLTFVF